MRLMLISLYCFSATFFSSQILAQNIVVDFTKKEITGGFDYDQHFYIEVLGLDPTVEYVQARIWNTTKMDGVLSEMERDISYRYGINNDNLLGHEKIPGPYVGETRLLEPYDDKKKRKGRIQFVEKLKPNNTFFIRFYYGQIKELTKSERNAVKNKIEKAGQFQKLLVALDKTVSDSGIDYAQVLSHSTTINSAAKSIVASLDGEYRWEELATSSVGAIVQEANLKKALIDYSQRLADMKKSVKTIAKSDFFVNNAQSPLVAISKKWTGVDITSQELEAGLELKKVDDIPVRDRVRFGKRKKELKTAIDEFVKARNAIVPMLIDNLMMLNVKIFAGSRQTFELDDQKNRKNYVFVDLGYGMSGSLSHFSQLAISFHFRPIKSHIPLRQYQRKAWFLNAFAIVGGITLTGNFENEKHKGILGENRSVMLGLGFRPIPGLKINGGYLGYYDHPSPLVEHRNLRATPYLAVALDFNITPAWKKNQENN